MRFLCVRFYRERGGWFVCSAPEIRTNYFAIHVSSGLFPFFVSFSECERRNLNLDLIF